MGPFSVYLRALLGPRRVLLPAAAIFLLCSILLPLSPNLGVMLTLLVISPLYSPEAARGVDVSSQRGVRWTRSPLIFPCWPLFALPIPSPQAPSSLSRAVRLPQAPQTLPAA